MGLFSHTKSTKKEYKTKLKEAGRSYGIGNGKYLGGHPDLTVTIEGSIKVNKLGFFIDKPMAAYCLHIPIANIISAETETKSDGEHLIIRYNDDGIEGKADIKSNNAGVLSSGLMKAKKEQTINS